MATKKNKNGDDTDFPLPTTVQSVCESAIELITPILDTITEGLAKKYVAICVDLDKVPPDKVNMKPIIAMTKTMAPLSHLFGTHGKGEELLQVAGATIPSDSLFFKELDTTKLDDPKPFLAILLLYLIVKLQQTEQTIFKQAPPVDVVMATKILQPIAHQIGQMYNFLLHFDSEFALIKAQKSREKGTARRNTPATTLHAEFYDFYQKNKHLSQREAARRFYEALPKHRQIYLSTEHAQRQLTAALRKRLKDG